MPAIKDRAAAFLLSRIGATARITAIAQIAPRLTAVQLYLPTMKGRWTSTQHIKCAVAPYTFRDYTLASWDDTTQIATILVDTGHEGPGSDFFSQLHAGDEFTYAGPGGGVHQPGSSPNLVCIGDRSSLGHFTSLYSRKAPLQSFHCIINTRPGQLPSSLWGMPIQCFSYLPDNLANVRMQLQSAGVDMPLTTYFVAGQSCLVKDVRRALKDMNIASSHIKAAAFWR